MSLGRGLQAEGCSFLFHASIRKLANLKPLTMSHISKEIWTAYNLSGLEAALGTEIKRGEATVADFLQWYSDLQEPLQAELQDSLDENNRLEIENGFLERDHSSALSRIIELENELLAAKSKMEGFEAAVKLFISK